MSEHCRFYLHQEVLTIKAIVRVTEQKIRLCVNSKPALIAPELPTSIILRADWTERC